MVGSTHSGVNVSNSETASREALISAHLNHRAASTGERQQQAGAHKRSWLSWYHESDHETRTCEETLPKDALPRISRFHSGSPRRPPPARLIDSEGKREASQFQDSDELDGATKQAAGLDERRQFNSQDQGGSGRTQKHGCEPAMSGETALVTNWMRKTDRMKETQITWLTFDFAEVERLVALHQRHPASSTIKAQSTQMSQIRSETEGLDPRLGGCRQMAELWESNWERRMCGARDWVTWKGGKRTSDCSRCRRLRRDHLRRSLAIWSEPPCMTTKHDRTKTTISIELRPLLHANNNQRWKGLAPCHRSGSLTAFIRTKSQEAGDYRLSLAIWLWLRPARCMEPSGILTT